METTAPAIANKLIVQYPPVSPATPPKSYTRLLPSKASSNAPKVGGVTLNKDGSFKITTEVFPPRYNRSTHLWEHRYEARPATEAETKEQHHIQEYHRMTKDYKTQQAMEANNYDLGTKGSVAAKQKIKDHFTAMAASGEPVPQWIIDEVSK